MTTERRIVDWVNPSPSSPQYSRAICAGITASTEIFSLQADFIQGQSESARTTLATFVANFEAAFCFTSLSLNTVPSTISDA